MIASAFYLPMQHIYITDYQWPFILIGTTSVLTDTQNVGTNANRCVSWFCIYVLYRLFSALLWSVRYQIQVLNDRVFPQICYRTLVEYKGSDFLGISVGYIGIYILEYLIRLKKCSKLWLIHWEKCNLFQLFVGSFRLKYYINFSGLSFTINGGCDERVYPPI